MVSGSGFNPGFPPHDSHRLLRPTGLRRLGAACGLRGGARAADAAAELRRPLPALRGAAAAADRGGARRRADGAGNDAKGAGGDAAAGDGS